MFLYLKKIFIVLVIISINQFTHSTEHLNKETIDNYVFELLPHKSNKAKRYLKKNINNPYCCYLLGTIYLTEKDFKNANKYLTQAAENGSLEAINSIGDGYYSGKDHKEALKCYVDAAKKGNGTAQFNAGSVYFKYSKSIRTLEKAIYWFDKASKNDDIKDLREYIIICKKTAENKLKEIKKQNNKTNNKKKSKTKHKNKVNKKTKVNSNKIQNK